MHGIFEENRSGPNDNPVTVSSIQHWIFDPECTGGRPLPTPG